MLPCKEGERGRERRGDERGGGGEGGRIGIGGNKLR